MLKFLQPLALDFPYICLQFSWEIFTDKGIDNLKKEVLGFLAHVTPSFFFSRILKVSVKENEVPTEKNSSRASIFATKASYISN